LPLQPDDWVDQEYIDDPESKKPEVCSGFSMTDYVALMFHLQFGHHVDPKVFKASNFCYE
jgi:hypothetical protein